MRTAIRMLGLVGVLALLGGHLVAVSAQSPVPTVTADGCADIPGYLADRQAADDEMRLDWGERFPGVAYPSDMSDDEWDRLLLGLTPDEFESLADHWLFRVDLFENMDAPPIVQPYHELTIERARVRASAFRSAITLGVVVAAITYSETLDQIVADRHAYSVLALQVCPAFADILIFNGEIPATPVAA